MVGVGMDLLQEGLDLQRRGALAEAAVRYAQVLRADPGNADAHYYLGMMSCQQGRFADGAERARQALRRDPHHARAHVLLGRALSALGQRGEALANFDRAIALEPDFARAHGHRADLLGELGRNPEAVESYDRALALAPDTVADWFNRGTALLAVGRYGDALASFDRALALNPDFAEAHLLRAPRLLSKLRLCDWTDLEAETAELLAMIREQKFVSVPFAALLLPASPAEQLQCARRYVQEQSAAAPIWRGEVYSHSRIRVAYLSADFREHATAYLTAGLFEQHDRSRFEITAISFGEDDASPIRRRLESAFEHFIDVRNESDRDIAELIRRNEIDIAVDLMGFTKGNRPNILAQHPAPIQLNYLGFPSTMGATFIDYIVADSTVIGQADESNYAERVVRLPDSYQINDDKRQIASAVPTRGECGLPESAFVYCCFNSTQKLTPRLFDVWMRLLHARENSVLWLLEDTPTATANLRAQAERRGVSGQRLVFAPKVPLADHLARHRRADLFLDTLPYNAHTTASDALWAGLPVVTCMGGTFAGRVAASLLKASGLDDLIVGSLDEYEALALSLARDPPALAAIKNRLAQNRVTCPLFDTKRTTRHIELAYAMMVERLRRGERPATFAVEATAAA
jgi:protein O-GlcNAc transferase